MNKTAIKNYAVWARRKLIESVKQRAFEYEITDGGANDPGMESIAGRPLTQAEKDQRRQLIAEIRDRGFEPVMEEAAYTWFNRFIALRFMEVNGYLPSRVRVFTDENGEFKPEILKQALEVDLEGLDRERVLALMDAQDNEGLYQYLLITQCNALNEALPYMFEKISNWTELLFPANLLRPESVIARMVADIPEEDWTDQVQIIGWLYQFYNSELKDDTYALLKKNVKISKERLPSATQLFTPDWIVRYMVENSLGRLAVSSQLAAISSSQPSAVDGQQSESARIVKEKEIAEAYGWKYYLPEAEQEPEVRAELNNLHSSFFILQSLKFLDPCTGSGHVLVYAFDVLLQLYSAEGWSERDAVKSILENNLYGLDIDTRAGQLAYFSVMMKARKYNRRIFTAGIRPNIFAIRDSAFLDEDLIRYVAGDDTARRDSLHELKETFRDAGEYGSLIRPEISRLDQLWDKALMLSEENAADLIAAHFREIIIEKLLPLLSQAKMLSDQYDVVCTNPPYMGSSGMSPLLLDYVKSVYPNSKSDLFSVFMERCIQYMKIDGYVSMITMQSWMFLSSFENLRKTITDHHTIVNMLHLGARGFDEIGGEVVQTAAFTLENRHINSYRGIYCRLIEPKSEAAKREMFLSCENRYSANQENFSKIPGSPIAYWVEKSFFYPFEKGKLINEKCQSTKGIVTGDNDRFLRLWWEIRISTINFNAINAENAAKSNAKWFPCTKGGAFRRWYGNKEYIIDWENHGYRILKNASKEKRHSQDYYHHLQFQQGISWTKITSSGRSFRIENNNLIEQTGLSIFPCQINDILPMLGYLNSPISDFYLNILASTITLNTGDLEKLPIIDTDCNNEKIKKYVNKCIEISKTDWDSFETSWDFKKHPLI